MIIKCEFNIIFIRSTDKHIQLVIFSTDTTDDHTLLWLLNQIRLGIPQIRIQIQQHKYTHTYAFFIASTFEK